MATMLAASASRCSRTAGSNNVAIQHLLRRKDSTRASTQSHGLRDAALWRWVTSGVTGRAGRSAAIPPELRNPAWILVSLLAPPGCLRDFESGRLWHKHGTRWGYRAARL